MGSWCGRPKQDLIRDPGAVFICSSLSRTPRHCTFGGEEMILPSQHIYIFVATQGFLHRAGRPMVNAAAECGNLNICIRLLHINKFPHLAKFSSFGPTQLIFRQRCSHVTYIHDERKSEDLMLESKCKSFTFKSKSRHKSKSCPSSPCPGHRCLQTDVISLIFGVIFLESKNNALCLGQSKNHGTAANKHTIHIAKKWHNMLLIASSLKHLYSFTLGFVMNLWGNLR